jgi:NADPH:quinone reductase-like Zn-dependent oxidoreductase
MLLGPILSRFGSKKTRYFVAKVTRKDLEFMKELLEAGNVVPAIDRCFPLPEAAEALRYLEAGHPRGKVVITV